VPTLFVIVDFSPPAVRSFFGAASSRSVATHELAPRGHRVCESLDGNFSISPRMRRDDSRARIPLAPAAVDRLDHLRSPAEDVEATRKSRSG
jgi:hypothetical protein